LPLFATLSGWQPANRQKVLDIWAGFADYPKAANGID
jgi:hypothetical protein